MRKIRYTASPLLAAKAPVWRSKFLVAGMALAFLLLIVRAVDVQVVRSAFYQDEAGKRIVRTIELPASRGSILDRNGRLLASSVEAPSIWAVPSDVPKSAEQLDELAGLLEMQPQVLREKLEKGRNFVWLKRQVDAPVARQVAALGIPGIHQQKDYKRKYPEGEPMAHVVGFANIDNQGQEGAEASFEQQLAGHPGVRQVLRDRLGRAVEEVGEEVSPVDGADVYLSIDARVQSLAYQKLRDAVKIHRAKAGSAVVLDARTGEILALANYPSYSPDQRATLRGSQLRNLAVTDTFEPGSTMKPITVAIAMDAGKVRPDTRIETAPGWYRMHGYTIRDVRNHGTLTVQGVVQKSSNIGALKIAQLLTAQQMWDSFVALGYGRKPDIAFPGVASGNLHFWKSWGPTEQATMAYGYGISTSLLQMTHSYVALARDGEIIPMSLLRRAESEPVYGMRVFNAPTARAVREMLHLVVEAGGTATQARAVGYSVGGKTGTARKQAGKGYADKKYSSWFIGMAPIDKPRIVVGVMVDEPGAGAIYGGAVAAPVFSDIVQQTLRMQGVRPDLMFEQDIVARAAMGDPS